MKVIRPIAITGAMLGSSSIAETDYAAWSSGTTYADKARVIRTSVHRIFESIGGSNVGNTPETTPAKWLDVGPTNRWAMLDQSVGTVSTATGSITLTLSPGAIDTLALIDVQGVSAHVTVSVSGTVIYDRTIPTAAGGEIINDWYRYFFAPRGTRTALIFQDLPAYPSAIITVVIDAGGAGAIAACGTLSVGRYLDCGSSKAGAGVGIDDFSRKETDDFGVTSIVERAFRKRATVRTLMPSSFVDTLQRELAKLRATPAVWFEAGSDSLTIYGFYKSFDLDLALANISYCSLTLEGLSTAN